MNPTTGSQEVFEQVNHEHEALREKLRRIHDVLAGADPAANEIATLLREFQAALELHFSNEEKDGFFAEVTTYSPSLTHEADRLCVEHGQLRRTAAELCRFAAAGSPSLPWWRELGSRCHAFSKLLMHHESEENQLLQQAHRQDIGVVD